jgi:aryl-alcohol dehydrogenase-like predicted oxidoreductase
MIPMREFGKTGAKVSALGLGGHHLGQTRSEDEAIQIIHEAVDGGITFFDNCWEYHLGLTELFLGKGSLASVTESS